MNTLSPLEILLVEDNPGDVRLILEAFKENRLNNRLSVAADGLEAVAFLRQEGKFVHATRPDLILLDLNLPKKDGRSVLSEIKNDTSLKYIPVIVLTTSSDEQDVLTCYEEQANAFVTKPADLDQLFGIVREIDRFWHTVARLPHSYA